MYVRNGYKKSGLVPSKLTDLLVSRKIRGYSLPHLWVSIDVTDAAWWSGRTQLIQPWQRAESAKDDKVFDHEQLTLDVADARHGPQRHHPHRLDVVEQCRRIEEVDGSLEHRRPENNVDSETQSGRPLWPSQRLQLNVELKRPHDMPISTVWAKKKQDTLLVSITSRNINRFSKFFHR